MLSTIYHALTFGVEIESLLPECDRCYGEGTYECPHCEGRGWVECDYCEGAGEVVCSRCDGEGEIECPHCEGEGCGKCDGTGYITCPKCVGSQYMTCPECDDGSFTCEECDGEGTVTCHECDGRGRANSGSPPYHWSDHSEHCGWEFVSPVYELAEDWKTWEREIREVLDMVVPDPEAIPPTGMHVHVGVNEVAKAVGINPYGLMRRILEVWMAIQDVIVGDIAKTTAERMEWADVISDSYADTILCDLGNKRVPLSDERYYVVNFNAYRRHGTVEFRLWNASDDLDYVMTAVGYSTGVVAYAAMTMHSLGKTPNKLRVLNFLGWWTSYVTSRAKEVAA